MGAVGGGWGRVGGRGLGGKGLSRAAGRPRPEAGRLQTAAGGPWALAWAGPASLQGADRLPRGSGDRPTWPLPTLQGSQEAYS